MKHKIFFLIASVALLFAACQEDEPAPIASVEVNDVVVDASYKEATIQWRVASNATMQEVVLEYSTDSTFAEFAEAPMSKVNPKSNDNLYQVSLHSLAEGTKYYIRSRVVNKINSLASLPHIFETKVYQLASVTTDSITDITVSSAKLHATLLDWGMDTLPEVGFCMSTHANVTIADSCLVCSFETDQDSMAYTIALDNLSDNTTFYARAYAKNSKGIAYGEELSFTTFEIGMPQVGSTIISEITYTSAKATSEVLSDGDGEIIERGICYSTSQYPTISDTKIQSGSGLGSFVCNLTNLAEGTIYHVRAYATNGKGTSYGEDVVFTTVEVTPPIIGTIKITRIAYKTTTIESEILSDGGTAIIEQGVCYSSSSRPVVTDYKVESESGLGVFSCKLSNLIPGRTYYVRSYAINNKGVSYSEEVEFISPISATDNGALSGAFSVSATKKVRFSQGNLQYQASTNSWRFAENQYDCIGAANTEVSPTYSGWIDLFGWGTSGYDNTEKDSSATNFHPWSWRSTIAPIDSTLNCEAQEITGDCVWDYTYPSTMYNAYGYGPSTNMPDANLIGTSSNYDWGIYNAIANGGNTTGTWRTLASEEFQYLLSSRTNANYLKIKATVNERKGLILLPDNFIKPTEITWTYNTEDYTTNTFTILQWELIQDAGAVFLPCSGFRGVATTSTGEKVSIFNKNSGYYWTSSSHSKYYAYWLEVSAVSETINNNGQRKNGCAVRLVQDVQ